MLPQIFTFADYNRDRFIAEFAKSLPAGTTVLDAGAGPCKYRSLFAHCQYKSQDFAAYVGDDCKYGELDYVSDITAIPVHGESFDCVICTEVLEHVPEPHRVIGELARIVKPGGKILITAPLGSGIHMPPYHFFGGFTPYWYERMFAENGLCRERLEANGGFFRHYGQESRRFLYMLTPRSMVGRLLFFPIKVLLAGWFRVVMPVACHFLDAHDKDRHFTVGYHVVAYKPIQQRVVP